MDELTFRTLRNRAWVLAAFLVAAAILLSPPVLGLLLSADGEIGPGARRKAVILASTVLAMAGALLALVAWRRSWLERGWRRRGRVMVVAVVLAGIATGEFGRRFLGAEQPAWTAAVDFGHPLMTEVARLHRGGDDDAAFAALVEVFAAHKLAAGPWTPWLQLALPARAEAVTSALVRGRIDFIDGKQVAWRPGETFPWSELNATQIFALEQGEHAVAALVGRDNRAPGSAERAGIDATMRAFFVQWSTDARWRHRNWPGANPHVWGDGPAPNRLMALLGWLQRWTAEGPLAPDDARALLRLVLRHRSQLLHPGILNDQTNHGLMQNGALLGLSTAYPFLDPGGVMASLARTRSSRYFQNKISRDGVSLELSPGYHCTIAHLLIFHAAMRARGGERLADSERAALAAMVDFARQFRLPNGAFPRIANTGAERACRELDGWIGADGALDALGITTFEGESGAAALVRAWPGAGYMLARTEQNDAVDVTPMAATLMAGPASIADGHSDKLSLTLYGGGRSLIGGPGYVSTFNGRRAELIRSLGQSAVHLDGESQVPGRAEIVHLASEVSGTSLVSAVLAARHQLHDDAVVERAVFFGAGQRSWLVLDTVQSTRSRLVSIHDRALDGGVGKASGDAMVLRWDQAPVVHLRIRRQARIDGGSAASLPVRWRPPMAWSEVRGGDVVVATIMTLGAGSAEADGDRSRLAFVHALGSDDDDSGAAERDAGALTWSREGLSWQGSAGTWQIPLASAGGPADAVKGARFTPTQPQN